MTHWLESAWPWAPTAQGRAQQRKRFDGVLEYLHIGGDQLPAEIAAARLGVTDSTVYRWRRALRQINVSRETSEKGTGQAGSGEIV